MGCGVMDLEGTLPGNPVGLSLRSNKDTRRSRADSRDFIEDDASDLAGDLARRPSSILAAVPSGGGVRTMGGGVWHFFISGT